MSLLDLSSDLSRYRSTVRRDEKNTAEASVATNNKNFATMQPLTAKLSQFVSLAKKNFASSNQINSSDLSKVIKFAADNMLVNSVSNYSPVNRTKRVDQPNGAQLQNVISALNNLQQTKTHSRLDKSNVIILKPSEPSDKLNSPITISSIAKAIDRISLVTIDTNSKKKDVIVNPNISINKPKETIFQKSPSIDANKATKSSGVINPNIAINTIPISIERTSNVDITRTPSESLVVDPKIVITKLSGTKNKNTVVIHKDLISPINNVINPNVILSSVKLFSDRKGQSPNIVRNTIKEGLVVDPHTKIIKVEEGTFHLKDESRLNNDSRPIRFTTESKLVNKKVVQQPDTNRYDGKSNLLVDHSNLNVDSVTYTIPYGRNENPDKSKFSIKGIQAINFFDDFNAKGFTVRSKRGDSKFISNSDFVWDGGSKNAPVANYMTDTNALGFTTFAQSGKTLYKIDSSVLGFTKPSDSDHFDIAKQYTTEGFKSFTTPLKTAFKINSTQLGWQGSVPPTGNYFDLTNLNTTAGFESYAKLLDSKFKLGSSQFDWDGAIPPEVNYFDLSNLNTTAGFSKLAQLFDTKYKLDSSKFDWKGSRQAAPSGNYFDLTNSNTTAGFHTFAQLLDSKFVSESSKFDWDGSPADAPQTDFFDITKRYQTTGFNKFPVMFDSKYIVDASDYNWDGTRQQAPEVDFFDITKYYAIKGFEKFTQKLVTKYNVDASDYNWDGSQQQAPEVNYFDLKSKYTTKGFEKFTPRLVTRYITDASDYNWDGTRQQAPEVDFFGNSNQSGFKKFVIKLKSDYKKDTSEFVFKGTLPRPVDFFDNTDQTGFINKTQLLATKFTKHGSKFVFRGSLPSPVDFFSNTPASGFTIKTQAGISKYKSNVSQFVFKGTGHNAPEANYFIDINASGYKKYAVSLETKFNKESSRFTFIGTGRTAPEVDNLSNLNADGFTSLIPQLQTKFRKNSSKFAWSGTRQDAPEVNYFNLPTPDNTNVIDGFTKFFSSKTDTKYSVKNSRLSFAGTDSLSKIKNVPFTNFFGFTPYERSGFLVGMNSGESSLYPIVDPRLTATDPPDSRFRTEAIRSERKQLTTAREEKYAPLSLGKRPWSDGGLFATLENQIPNIKTKAAAGSVHSKYENTMREKTGLTGYLTDWAITRHSPSPLDDQYNKYKLQKEAHNSEPAFFNQPYVVRGIQRMGEVENQRWGFGAAFDEGITRGGVTVQAERILQDVVRIGKWTASVKGLLFNIKQAGLQAMNPAVDVDPNTPTSGLFGISATLGYNPLTLMANVASARAGVHLARHGLFPMDSDFLNKYEKGTINRELNNRFLSPYARKFDSLEQPVIAGQQTNYNRLIGLARELLPNSYKPNAKISSAMTSPLDGGIVNGSAFTIQSIIDSGIDAVKKLLGISEIARISSNFGGAQSYLGLGGTKIRRSSHPYFTIYTTAPNLSKTNTKNTSTVTSGGGGMSLLNSISQHEPQYTQAAKKDIFYANAFTYADNFKSSAEFLLLKALSHHLKGATEPNNSSTIPPSGIQQPDLTRLEKLHTFDFKYPNRSSRVDAIDEFSAERTGDGMHLGVQSSIVDHDNPIKKYRTLSYDKLQKSRAGIGERSTKFNDFRADLELSGSESFITNPKVARYASRNLEDYFGMGNQGKVGAQRNLPFMTNIEYTKKSFGINTDHSQDSTFKEYAVPKLKEGQEFRGDRINIIDYKRANFKLNKNLVYEKGEYGDKSLQGANDLVEFYFTGVTLSGHKFCPAEVIVFRATFDTITDNHKPTWNSVKYMGRADPLYVYQSYERSISFGFTVHIGSRDEMKATWRKLNYLASWTAPEYTKAGFIRGPLVRLNIGNLWRKMPGYIGSLSYTFDNTQGTWETAQLLEDSLKNTKNKVASSPGVLQLPKTINVSCEFVPVGMYRPEFRGTMYSLYDDTNESFENGLIPKDPNAVNYFRTFDDKDITDESNAVSLPVQVGKETEIEKQDTAIEVVSSGNGESPSIK